mmetsp:Transcript_11127/g.33114  ORF Transcript_11127/g.33114 Transcript_11127/m.33114 type:complete len:108 (+) Transcript_11127:900-1223(+)
MFRGGGGSGDDGDVASLGFTLRCGLRHSRTGGHGESDGGNSSNSIGSFRTRRHLNRRLPAATVWLQSCVVHICTYAHACESANVCLPARYSPKACNRCLVDKLGLCL